jgi:DNA repair exonuclease SbcCD nuclease subunit
LNIPENKGDVLVIAGDISHYNSQTKEFLMQVKEIYDYVVFVHGNHDLYLISNSQKSKYQYQSKKRIEELHKIAKETYTTFLDGTSVTIKNKTIAGTCGWYNLPTFKDKEYWRRRLNDSNFIYDGYPVPLAYSYGSSNPDWDTQKFYEEETEKLKNLPLCDVLVTHVSQVQIPNFAMNQKYRGSKDNIFYSANNIELVQQKQAKYYIYGHVHDFQEFKIPGVNDTICLSNPFGYPHEAKNKKIIQIQV